MGSVKVAPLTGFAQIAEVLLAVQVLPESAADEVADESRGRTALGCRASVTGVGCMARFGPETQRAIDSGIMRSIEKP